MPRDDAAYLLDMLLAARDAARFVTGEITAEAAARPSAETKHNYP